MDKLGFYESTAMAITGKIMAIAITREGERFGRREVEEDGTRVSACKG